MDKMTGKLARQILNALRLTILPFSLALIQSLNANAESHPTIRIGNFVPTMKDAQKANYIWSIAAENAKVGIHVGGSESFAASSCPDVWLFRGGTVVSPAYTFQETHGIQIRFTSTISSQISSLPISSCSSPESTTCSKRLGYYIFSALANT